MPFHECTICTEEEVAVVKAPSHSVGSQIELALLRFILPHPIPSTPDVTKRLTPDPAPLLYVPCHETSPRYGRRNGCMLWALLNIIQCVLIRSKVFGALVVGRIIAGEVCHNNCD